MNAMDDPGFRLRQPPEEFVDERVIALTIRQRIAHRMSAYTQSLEEAGLPAQSLEQQRDTVRSLIGEELTADAAARLGAGSPPLFEEVEERVTRMVLDGLFGLGAIQRWLDDDNVENVIVNGCDTVFVRYADGRKEKVPPIAGSDTELIELIRAVAARTGEEERHFDRSSPWLNLQLPDGSRLFAVMSVTERVSLSIRRHRYPRLTVAKLQEMGVCDESLASFLASLVRARKNVIIAGGVNIGKTTVLRGLAAEIPSHERLVTIEDTLELGLDHDRVAHPDVVAMQAREPNIERQGAIDQAELVRWGLRMAPDRVIVGEIRGAEVIPMCNAMSQGNDGSLSTIHSSTSAGVFTKLGAYAAQSPERLTLDATNLLVASALHFVVHLGWSADGKRVVDSVREIVGSDGPQVISNEVYRPGPDGRATPSTPPRADTLDELIAAGLDAQAWWTPNWGDSL
ncbi:CpaF family protein [Embleya sp. NPDC055664]